MNGHSPLGKGVIKEKLRDIWAHVLNQDAALIDDTDAFFDVGGDSMLAHDVIVAAQGQGIILDMQNIFLSTSLDAMCEAVLTVDARHGDQDGSSSSPASTAPELLPNGHGIVRHQIAEACDVSESAIEHSYPCSPMQESLVVEADGHKNSYVIQCVFTLDGRVSIDQLRQAWEDVILENPVLRTRICQVESASGFVQAVIREQARWTETTGDIAQFLEHDAGLHMRLGQPFSRYAIIVNRGDRDGPPQQYFVWTIHHALCDAASLEEILCDVSRRFVQDPLPERQSFESFIESCSSTPGAEREQEFWQRNLANVKPSLYPAPQVSNFQPSPTGSLEWPLFLRHTPSFGVTPALLLRAAWAVLSSHYSGTEQVVFGTINNGRSSAPHNVGRTTGPTIGLVPTTVHVDPQQTVASFLSDIRIQAAEIMPFEHSGLSKIRKCLAGVDSASLRFQTLLIIQPADPLSRAKPALQTLGLEHLSHMGKRERHPYPLVLTFTLTDDTLIKLHVQYDARVVPKQEAGNLVYHFQEILMRLSIATSTTLLGCITPFSDYDMGQIRRWNEVIYPAEETCIQDLFQKQVRAQPDAVAVCSLDQSLTYREVDEYSSYLAAHLVELGVCLGSFVAVCFEKSIWTVVSILAVFKAGAVYVPIDPEHPQSRTKEVIDMARVGFAMVSKAGLVALAGLNVQTIVVHHGIQPPMSAAPRHISLPSSSAYLLFTSGTTGKPKGILMSHSAICTSIIHHGAAFGAGKRWRTLQFAAHTFDLSIGEFFTTLAFGGCICVPSQHDRLNDLAGAITALEVNTLLVVPTVLNLLSPADVPTLKTVVLAGEPIPSATVAQWANKVDLTCAYGPSETAVWCSANLRVSSDSHSANIGRAFGASMWLVQPHDYRNLVAVGCIGEIIISGPLVGQGYFEDEAATEAAFVEAPDWLRHTEPNSNTVYRSGDLARYNPDGTMHILGRRDTQVKLRGFRIELGEIENRIMEHAEVTAVLAALPTTGACAGQLVAVFSSQKSTLWASSASDIRIWQGGFSMVQRLKQHVSLCLPSHMSPSIWVPVAKMPLLISGKLDRKSTTKWIETMSNDSYTKLISGLSKTGAAEIKPESLASRLRELWSEVLQLPVELIGLETSFLSIGGDSIAAVQVVSRGYERGLHLTVRGVIGAKTLGDLAALTEQDQQSSNLNLDQLHETQTITAVLQAYQPILQSRLIAQPSVRVQDAYFLSPIQELIMKARAADPSLFILSVRMEIKPPGSGSISIDRIARAWELVVQKFPILRSIFFQDPAGELPTMQVVLTGAASELQTSTAIHSDIEPTFDSVRMPSVDDCFLRHRALIYQHGGRFFIHIEFDHLVVDGWSLQLIKAALLEACEYGDLFDRSERHYRDFVVAHHPNRVQADDEYWAAILRDQRPCLLSFSVAPTPGSHGRELRPHGIKTRIPLPHFKAKSISHFCMAYSITPASVFNAAWAQTLSFHTNSADVLFEYVVSGRDENIKHVFDIAGPLLNVVPHHLHGVTNGCNSADLALLAQTVQEQQMQDRSHTRSNIKELIERKLDMPKLFNTAVNFQRRPSSVDSGVWRLDEDLERTQDPWHFEVLLRILHITDDDTFRCYLEFDADIFEYDRVRLITEHFWDRLQAAVSFSGST